MQYRGYYHWFNMVITKKQQKRKENGQNVGALRAHLRRCFSWFHFSIRQFNWNKSFDIFCSINLMVIKLSECVCVHGYIISCVVCACDRTYIAALYCIRVKWQINCSHSASGLLSFLSGFKCVALFLWIFHFFHRSFHHLNGVDTLRDSQGKRPLCD